MLDSVVDFLSRPWPWYVAGPLVGLTVPLLLVVTGKTFGLSSSLRHTCAATVPGKSAYLDYDWRRQGLWNLTLIAGIMLGGFIAGTFLLDPEPVAISEATQSDLVALGIEDFSSLMPPEVYSLEALTRPAGWLIMVLGGFLVGFGARYADGCTSGHGITGLAMFQPASLVAILAFFAGGIAATHLLLPLILRGGS